MNQKPLFLIITALALLIIGGAFWFIQKQPVVVNQPTVSEPVSQVPVQTEPDKYPQHIVAIPGNTDEVWYNIPELGVRMKLNKEFAEDLVYADGMVDDYGNHREGIYFSTKGISEVAPECAPLRGGAIGFIFKSKGNVKEKAKTDEYLVARINDYIQINDYYYGWVGPQAMCAFLENIEAVQKTKSAKDYAGSGTKYVSDGLKTIELIPQK